MGTSPLSTSSMFSGSSRFSNDFQQVITRAVKIASLPLNQINNGINALQSQSSELGTLSTKLTAVQTAIASIGTATGTGSYAVSVSDNKVSATVGDAVLPGTYTVEVVGLGSYNNTMSLDGLTKVTDPAHGNLSASTNFTLTVSGQNFGFSANNLNDMAAQINGSGLGVQASIVNVGSVSSPDYRLSVQGTKLGALGISLVDDASPTPNQLLNTLAGGATAQYKVNGYATITESDSRSVEIAPGLTVNLLAETGANPVSTITVSRTADAAKDAFSSFITAYNAAVDEVTKNRGQGGGALTGQGVVYTIDQALSSIVGYSPGSGAISSLEDIGVSIDKDGKLSLDSTTFGKNAAANPNDLMTFLGGATTGGFLKAATDTLTSLEDPTNGAVQLAMQSVSSQIVSQSALAGEEQDRITNLQNSLNTQMAAADAAIATLEQQASYISQLLTSMQDSATSYK